MSTQSNRLLLAIVGESFRCGGQHSRNTDSAIGALGQAKATASHIDWIDYIFNEHGITIDIQFIGYETRWTDKLIQSYEPYNCEYTMYKYHHKDRTQLANSISIQNLESYDSVLYIRPDLCFREYFKELFDPEWNKLYYPSVACGFRPNQPDSYNILQNALQRPRVNDTMMFVPSLYFDKVIRSGHVKLYHEAIEHYVDSHRLAISDFGFMLPSLHDSDTAKEYNPIYKMVGRDESFMWEWPNCEISQKEDPLAMDYGSFSLSRDIADTRFPWIEQHLRETQQDTAQRPYTIDNLQLIFDSKFKTRYNSISFDSQRILDLGCGHIGNAGPMFSENLFINDSSPQVFLNYGAQRVVGVHERAEELTRLANDLSEYIEQKKLILLEEHIDDTRTIERLIREYNINTIKCDLENDREKYLLMIEPDLFKLIDNFFIETHSQDGYTQTIATLRAYKYHIYRKIEFAHVYGVSILCARSPTRVDTI